MNSLYVFYVNEKRFFVAAKTWKEARNILVKLPEYKDLQLTEISGYRLSPKATTQCGILTSDYVFSKIPWWTCKCGNRSFIPLDSEDACRCKKCGRETRLNLKK